LETFVHFVHGYSHRSHREGKIGFLIVAHFFATENMLHTECTQPIEESTELLLMKFLSRPTADCWFKSNDGFLLTTGGDDEEIGWIPAYDLRG